jgi:sucrose-phosphate synthase
MAGLYVLHLHLHGLFRGHDLELGRDADTGGQTTYVLELARSLALRPEVERLEVVTRLIRDRRVSADYAQPWESLGPHAAIRRLAFGPRRYLRKELLWPHLDELADALAETLLAQDQLPNRACRIGSMPITPMPAMWGPCCVAAWVFPWCSQAIPWAGRSAGG